MVTNVLDKVQADLAALGLQDVKFFFSLGVNSDFNSDVERSVAGLMTSYLAGDVKPLPAVGDLGCAIPRA